MKIIVSIVRYWIREERAREQVLGFRVILKCGAVGQWGEWHTNTHRALGRMQSTHVTSEKAGNSVPSTRDTNIFMLSEAHSGCLSGPWSKGCVFSIPGVIWSGVGFLWLTNTQTHTHSFIHVHTNPQEENSNDTQQLVSRFPDSVSTTLVSYNNSAGTLRGFTRHIYNCIYGSISAPEPDVKC